MGIDQFYRHVVMNQSIGHTETFDLMIIEILPIFVETFHIEVELEEMERDRQSL